MKFPSLVRWLAGGVGLLLGGCNYEAPITAVPTRPIEPQLLGNWVAVDKDDPTPDQMHVRKLDGSTYIISYNGEIFRAYHSDFAQRPFVSVQNLETADRKYIYFTWQLSPDGSELTLQAVTTRKILESTPDPAGIQKQLTQHLTDADLFGDRVVFTRERPPPGAGTAR